MHNIDTFKKLAFGLAPENFPFLTWNHNPLHGWKPVLAWNPENILDGYTSKEDLEKFFSNHKHDLVCGFMNYELGMKLQGVEPKGETLTSIPDLWFGAYSNWAEILNGQLIIHGDPPPATGSASTFITPNHFNSLITRGKYDKALFTIQDHIRKGNVYQANLTHFLETQWEGDPWQYFFSLLKKNPVDFAGCFLHPDFNIYSLSPEKFATFKGSEIFTEPVKGTRPRGKTEAEDDRERKALLGSSKEEAELNMITDLLRNDLGKVCKTGSIEVLRHRETMALSSVWHTYSIIRGKLPESTNPISALLSMMPGGSITGCPKKRAIEIINDLEIHRRNLYTGTMGLQYPDGSSEWNIAIRTVLHQDGRLLLGVGGGITIDSNADEEYNETLAKAKSFSEITP